MNTENATARDTDSVNNAAQYRRVLSYLRPFVGYFAIAVFGYALFAISQPGFAVLMEAWFSKLILLTTGNVRAQGN